jgi:hypothetical protein
MREHAPDHEPLPLSHTCHACAKSGLLM